jgi:hypothetical protein
MFKNEIAISSEGVTAWFNSWHDRKWWMKRYCYWFSNEVTLVKNTFDIFSFFHFLLPIMVLKGVQNKTHLLRRTKLILMYLWPCMYFVLCVWFITKCASESSINCTCRSGIIAWLAHILWLFQAKLAFVQSFFLKLKINLAFCLLILSSNLVQMIFFNCR